MGYLLNLSFLLKRLKALKFVPIFLFVSLAFANNAMAQAQPSCPSLPVYVLDLTNTSSKTLTGLKRESGSCCSTTDNSIQFKIILGPNSLGVRFDLSDNS